MRPAPLPVELRFGLSKEQAAEACGFGERVAEFESAVERGELPRPRRFGRRAVWSVEELRTAFASRARRGPRTDAVGSDAADLDEGLSRGDR